MLETLIQQLGRELKMEDQIITHEPGHYTIPFDDDITVDAIQLSQNYLLKGVIEKSPPSNTELFLSKVMQANLFGRGTRGAAIGLNSEGNTLTLSLELDYNSSYKDFYEKLEDFVSAIDFWRKEALNHH